MLDARFFDDFLHFGGEFRIAFSRLRSFFLPGNSHPFLAQVGVDLARVFLLAVQNILRYSIQCVVFGIKAKAKDIDGFTFPVGADFDRYEQRKSFFQRKLLQHDGGIDAIMIGDGCQPKIFADEMVDQLLRCPGAVAVKSVGLQVNGGVGGKNKTVRR